MIEAFLVSVIILVTTLLNALPIILGYANTPQWHVFLGTIHHPGDYFYYLSQFRQGQWSWMSGYNLFTNDFVQKTFVGWVNILLGKFFWFLGFDAIRAYHLSTILFTCIFLFLSYVLIRQVFPRKKDILVRVGAFVMFVTANAFPVLDQSSGGQTIYYATYWTNYAEPFTRLGGVPHHLITHSAIVAAFICMIAHARSKRSNTRILTAVLLGLTGVIIAGINPVQWVVVGATIGLTILIGAVRSKHARLAGFIRDVGTRSMPGAVFVLSGMPVAWYLKGLFSKLPYSQLAAWESAQQIRPGVMQFIAASGPVMVLGLVILVFFVKRHSNERLLIGAYLLASVTGFLSPIPPALHLLDIRFMSAVSYLAAAIVAAWGLQKLFKLNRVSVVIACCITLALAAIQFVPWQQQLAIRTTIAPFNAYNYITTDVYESYFLLQKMTEQDDTILVPWPFEGSMPALTGRHGYHGHQLLTIDGGKKAANAVAIFDETITDEEMQNLLQEENIDYILTFPGKPSPKPFLEILDEGKTLTLYKVL